MTTCPKCEQEFEYDPKHHRCPGEWEAICAEAGVAPVVDEYAGMTWADEMVARNMKPKETK